DNEFDLQRANKTLIEGTSEYVKTDINELTKAMETLKISRVEKKSDNNIQEIKDAIKDMAKAMKDLTKREGIPRQNERNTRLRYRPVNKIKDLQRKDRSLDKDNDKQKGPDIHFVELTNDESKSNTEYLLAELIEREQDIGD
ncbi:18552_t:CDS:2, partial [Racocetra fulgida]